MCLLTSNIGPCTSMSIGGTRKVWLARKANATQFRYVGNELGIIQWILNGTGTPTPFLEFECDREFVASVEDLRIDGNGFSFPQSIPLRFAAMTYEKRKVLETLINDRIVVVYQDENGRYWLIGQFNGLQASEYQATPDVQGGANRYTIRLSGLEVHQQREVMESMMIYHSPNGGGQTGTGTTSIGLGSGQRVLNNLGGSLPNGGITEDLGTWGQELIGGASMPLSQLGNVPIVELLQ